MTGTSGQPVYLDRFGPCLPNGNWDGPVPGSVALAVVCRTHVWNPEFEYYQLKTTPTYFNHQMNLYGLSWWVGAGQPPANQPLSIHFGGTLVHELGHWVRLIDLNCPAGQTMCNSAGSGADSPAKDTTDQFSLEAQDIADANSVY